LAEQAGFRQSLLSFAWPQWCICAADKLLAQTRRLVEMKEALTDFVNPGRGLWQRAPFASRDNDL
jgi:hypothetical protein